MNISIMSRPNYGAKLPIPHSSTRLRTKRSFAKMTRGRRRLGIPISFHYVIGHVLYWCQPNTERNKLINE